MENNQSVLITIGKLARHARRVCDRNLSDYGIHESWFRFLVALMHEGALCQKDLQNEFGLSKATVSQAVATLIENGYLIAEISPADRRQQRLSVTDKGRSLISVAEKDMRLMEQRIAEEIPAEELEVFLSCSQKLIGLFREELC